MDLSAFSAAISSLSRSGGSVNVLVCCDKPGNVLLGKPDLGYLLGSDSAAGGQCGAKNDCKQRDDKIAARRKTVSISNERHVIASHVDRFAPRLQQNRLRIKL